MKKILMLTVAGAVLSGPVFAAEEAAKMPHKKDSGAMWFDKVDENHDGVVTKEEFLKKHEERFAESDADKDGKITKEEAEAQKKKWSEEVKKKREERQKAKAAAEANTADKAAEEKKAE